MNYLSFPPPLPIIECLREGYQQNSFFNFGCFYVLCIWEMLKNLKMTNNKCSYTHNWDDKSELERGLELKMSTGVGTKQANTLITTFDLEAR